MSFTPADNANNTAAPRDFAQPPPPPKLLTNREKAKREIEFYQRQPGRLVPDLEMERTIQDITRAIDPEIRFQSSAIDLLHDAAEAHAVSVLSAAQTSAEHSGRITPLPKDIELVLRLIGNHYD